VRKVRRSSIAAAAAAFVAAGVASTSAEAAINGCSRAVAKEAIASVRPHIAGLGDTPLLVTPATADELICFDFTRDGRTDLAVTVASGGTAGDIGWIVLARTRTGWRLALSRSGYKIGLFRVGADLVDSQPVYRKNDPNCCPTGGFDHQRWHWNGSRFVIMRSWHDKSYRS
jgi:hypothetical protein